MEFIIINSLKILLWALAGIGIGLLASKLFIPAKVDKVPDKLLSGLRNSKD